MKKFSLKDNIKHWDEYALSHQNSKQGATFDAELSELENFFIIMELKKIKPRSMLDIGCGNGQRTAMFSNYVNGKTIGIDYSENMIKQAKTIRNHNLFFDCADITKYSTDSLFDVIISCRCIINQSTHVAQVELFKKLHRMLKPKGHLIIAEASDEGLRNLNRLRKEFGLKNIEEHWFNLHMKEKVVFPKISKLFKIKTIKRLGLYYYIARVVQPANTYPVEPKRGSVLDEIAKKTQLLFFNEELPFEQFGRHLLINFQKK